MTRTFYTKYSSIARTLTLIGAIIAIMGYVISIIEKPDLLVIAIGIIGVIISFLILSSIGSIKTRTTVPFTWWMLLIWVIVQAIILNRINFNLTGVGVLLEAIAMVLLLIDGL